mgnify:CR=1 FL=1
MTIDKRKLHVIGCIHQVGQGSHTETEGRLKMSFNTTDLKPMFDSRKSFYGKARTYETGDGMYLISYNTHVMHFSFKDGLTRAAGQPQSDTTMRHMKEFAAQNGYVGLTKADLLALPTF